jgi:dTDP-4-amino-4,6-dideoxygalactose transaminase
VFHQYTIRVPDRRDQVRALLADAGIETAIHYPTPVHCQPLYVQMGYQNGIVEAERASAQVLSLPVHPSLTRTDLEQIVQAVNAL